MEALHLIFGPQRAGKFKPARALAESVCGVRFLIDEGMGKLYGSEAPKRGKMKQNLWLAVTILVSIGFAASVRAADSLSEVMTSYQSAHDTKSIERVGKLVSFRTQDQSQRVAWLEEVSATFSSKIASIALIPFNDAAFMLPESELKRLPTTLKPVNWLAVELVPRQSDPDRTESVNYLIAVENGEYFIVGP